MRFREEAIFLTLFSVSGKTQLSLEMFPSVAALCLTAATDTHGIMTQALWTKIASDYCLLKPQEAELLFRLFEAGLVGCDQGAEASFTPTVHRLIVFLFCLVFRHTMSSKKSTLATDDSWPARQGGDDLATGMHSYFSLNSNVLLAALCLEQDSLHAGTVSANGMVITAEAINGLSYLFSSDPTSSKPFLEQFCETFGVSVGDTILKVTTSLSNFFNTVEYDCGTVIISSIGDSAGRTFGPNILADISLTSSFGPTNSYSYDKKKNHILLKGLSKAGIGVFGMPNHTPSTLVITGCSNCTVFVITPCSHVLIAGCRNVKVVLGTVSGTLTVCQCMRMTLSSLCNAFKVNSVEDCLFHVTCRTSCVHDCNNKTNKVAPYNYVYPSLDTMLEAQHLMDLCQQGENFEIRAFGPLGIGISETLTYIDPKTYCTALVPFESKALAGETKALPLILPLVFRQTMKERSEKLVALSKKIRDTSVTDEQRAAFETHCKEAFVRWVKASGLTTELLEITTAKMYELD